MRTTVATRVPVVTKSPTLTSRSATSPANQKAGVLMEVDGMQPIEQVTVDLLVAIEQAH